MYFDRFGTDSRPRKHPYRDFYGKLLFTAKTCTFYGNKVIFYGTQIITARKSFFTADKYLRQKSQFLRQTNFYGKKVHFLRQESRITDKEWHYLERILPKEKSVSYLSR
jgi:hypothetical protein